jgi:hypothetical protein
MSQIFKDAKQYVGQYDISGDSNQVSVSSACAESDTTCFGHGATRTSLGLETATVQSQGFHRLAANSGSNILRAKLNLDGQPWTVVPEGAAEGNRALFLPLTVQAGYNVGGSVGDKFPFSVNVKSQAQPLIQLGRVFAIGQKTANGTSTAFQLGAIPAGQALYATIHILGVVSSNVEITIERDTAEAFDDDPEDVISEEFNAADFAVGTSATAEADKDWYRVSWTLDGTSANVVVVLGIQ